MMQSIKQAKRSQSSPPRGAHRGRLHNTSKLSPPPSATSLDDQPITELTTKFDDNNPRSFPYSVKQQCWDKAQVIKGRDPDRWRRDPLGNTVFRKLVGCPGCLCHDYDHILPYSKKPDYVVTGTNLVFDSLMVTEYIANCYLYQGGKSTLDNCQVLQATVNRSKGNRTDISRADLIRRSSYCRVSGRDMDLFELSAYGNVRRGEDSSGCRIQ